MFYDLHVHTTASDGIKTPEEVILSAIEAGLAGLAITDHDTVNGLETARQFIQINGLEIDLIPGIELNTDYGDDEVHILGYFIDDGNEQLRNRLSEIRQQRRLRAEKMIAKLKGMGIQIEFEQVKALARGDLIGRPHIARALQAKGYVASEQEAFARYIDRGKPAYIPRYKFSPAEAISLINLAGGIAVLAHPGLIKEHSKIYEIIKLGIDGLEVCYPEHSQEQILEFSRLAQDNNLLVTGGSDFHGEGSTESRSHLCCSGVNVESMNQILEYSKNKKIKLYHLGRIFNPYHRT